MGMTLPHGGLRGLMESLKNSELTWHRSKLMLGMTVSFLPVDFAKPGDPLGVLRSNGLAWLALVSDDDQHQWHLYFDDVAPSGSPEYLLTKETFEALRRAVDIGSGKLDINGVHYRLHAAYLGETKGSQVHVALLMRVNG